MLAESATKAQALIRDPSHFQWYLVPLLLLVLHAYGEQAAERRWSVVLGGLAFWLMDWINEIANGLLARFSGFAPLWGAPGGSAYVLLIGLNVEISMMFAIMGLFAVRTLPADRHLKFFGINNRYWFASINAALCVMVECWLNHIGVLTWEWPFWGLRAPWLIFLIGYLPFFAVAYWVHDMASLRRKLTIVGVLAAVVVCMLGVFSGVLGWI